jgi:hypothetical protein
MTMVPYFGKRLHCAKLVYIFELLPFPHPFMSMIPLDNGDTLGGKGHKGGGGTDENPTNFLLIFFLLIPLRLRKSTKQLMNAYLYIVQMYIQYKNCACTLVHKRKMRTPNF